MAPASEAFLNIGYCGVDCAVCPDFLQGKCPNCRKTVWPEDDACLPVSCCAEKDISCCGECGEFPCAVMAEFYEESEGHRQAFSRMKTMRSRA